MVPSMADYPDDLDRLAEWRRKRANEEERRMVAGVESSRDLGQPLTERDFAVGDGGGMRVVSSSRL